MSTIGDAYLGPSGSETLLPRVDQTFSERDTEITNEARTADGTLVSDLRATKKHFEISYGQIEEDDLDVILGYYDLHEELSLIVTRKDTTTDTYTVVLRPMTRTRALVREIVLWSGLTLVLDEV